MPLASEQRILQGATYAEHADRPGDPASCGQQAQGDLGQADHASGYICGDAVVAG
jgi:hypothetical protein